MVLRLHSWHPGFVVSMNFITQNPLKDSTKHPVFFIFHARTRGLDFSTVFGLKPHRKHPVFFIFHCLNKLGTDWECGGFLLKQGSMMPDFRYRKVQIQGGFLSVSLSVSFQQVFARGYTQSTRCFLVSKVGVYQIQKLRMNLSGS